MLRNGIYRKPNKNYATPIDPNPGIRSHHKNPPFLLKFPSCKHESTYINSNFLSTSLHENNEKVLHSSLPPIQHKGKIFKNRPTRYLSPVFNIKNLQPLFASKKKVDQGLTAMFDMSDNSPENGIADSTYRISVVTRSNLRSTQ